MYEVFLILHFLGLALGVGTSFAFFTLGISTKSMTAEQRTEFMLRVTILGKNGSIGLTLLLVSGIGSGRNASATSSDEPPPAGGQRWSGSGGEGRLPYDQRRRWPRPSARATRSGAASSRAR